MTPECSDAIKFLELLLSECNGASEHSWRKCRRCLAISHIEGRQAIARRFIETALTSLRAGTVPPQHETVSPSVADTAPNDSSPSPDARTPGETLQRYGVAWTYGANQQMLMEAMPDGYWTPWHLAEAQIARLEQALTDAARAYNADVERVEGKESTLRSE